MSLKGCLVVFFFSNLNRNSGDHNQTPHSAASDLSLHYLAMSHKKDAGLIIWVESINL